MAALSIDPTQVKELRRQCFHHNIFPLSIGNCLDGEPPKVYAVLKPLVDSCSDQLQLMSVGEISRIVNSIPPGYRMMVEPVEEPLSDEYIARLAEYCIAAEIQKGYFSVKDVVRPSSAQSEVLAVCPELQDSFDQDGLLRLNLQLELLDGGIRYGEWLLHYHQFLRRGFTSNPNFDFLGTLARYRRSTSRLNSFRIAIDHRRIMRFADFCNVLELDTWYGPSFDREKLDDPDHKGLTVLCRNQPSPFDSSYPIVKTEVLWKTNEREDIKTLEIEELASAAHPYENWHINRYVHAERDMTTHVFRHFDGAAKVY